MPEGLTSPRNSWWYGLIWTIAVLPGAPSHSGRRHAVRDSRDCLHPPQAMIGARSGIRKMLISGIPSVPVDGGLGPRGQLVEAFGGSMMSWTSAGFEEIRDVATETGRLDEGYPQVRWEA